jgi:DNA-binding SARP family transcriptional activator/tetratricopeptide (TPR) repeat protein
MNTYLRLLGSPSVRREDEWLELPPGKTTALLYYLAYQEGWVSRDDLIYLFYPDTEEHKARQNLRPLLTTLRHSNYAAGLEIEPTRLRWNVDTDVQAFRCALHDRDLSRALEVYGGDLLAGFRLPTAPEFESWLEFERAALTRTWRKALLELVLVFEDEKRYQQAADVLERLHQADPLDEEMFRRYLLALAQADKAGDALNDFEGFKATLKREVDGEPEEATYRLLERIRSGAAVQDVQAHIALKKSVKRQFNMPLPTTPFVGRKPELDTVIQELRDPACRLLSIVAAGGMGKTRLALETGRRLLPEFEDGVYFVPFEAVSSPEFMVPAVAGSLGFTFFGPQAPKDQLLEYLGNKEMLLVMDNLEQLQEGTRLIVEMLERAPGLKILATSRELLNLHAEWVFDLGTMTLPQGNHDLQNSDAAALFVQAARRARADFSLARHETAVVRICRRVGGMPLALELAAQWLRVLTPHEVAEELEKGLDTLEGSVKDVPARHHSVRTVFEVSWSRLSDGEREALQRLSVFHGGFSKEAAQEVTAVGLPLLLVLCNKSFLSRRGDGHFSQHPLLWQYLREKASSDTETFANIQAKHAAYFAAFLRERNDPLQGLEAKAVRQEIRSELANVTEAWHWALAHEREDLLEEAAESLFVFYTDEGRYREAELLFSAAAKAIRSGSVVSGSLLAWLGGCYNFLTDYDTGIEVLQRSLAILEPHGSKRAVALALLILNSCSVFTNHPLDETIPILHRCLNLFHEAGDLAHEGEVRGLLAEFTKNPLEAERQFSESIELFRKSGKCFGVMGGMTLALGNFAQFLAQVQGAYPEAIRFYEEAIQIEKARGETYRVVWYLGFQAETYVYQGNYREAERCFSEGQATGATLESGWGNWTLANALYGLGWLAQLRGEFSEANAYLQRALEQTQSYDDPFGVEGNTKTTLGRIALGAGNLGEAESWCQDALRFFLPLTPQRSLRDWGKARCLIELGNIALASGNRQEATPHLHEALTVAREWHLLPISLHLCVSFADLLQQQGEEKRAGSLLNVAVNHPGSMFETKEAARRRLAAVPKELIGAGPQHHASPSLEEIVREILLGASS